MKKNSPDVILQTTETRVLDTGQMKRKKLSSLQNTVSKVGETISTETEKN